jgi:hypothetical protein
MILRRASTLSRPVVLRPAYSARVCYYHPPDVHSTKGEEFFIPPSYPDNLEDTPSLVKKPEKDMGHWEEIHATSSETSVRSSSPTLRCQGQVSRLWELAKAQTTGQSRPWRYQYPAAADDYSGSR